MVVWRCHGTSTRSRQRTATARATMRGSEELNHGTRPAHSGRGPEWQSDSEGASRAFPAAHDDAAAVLLDDLARAGQADPRPRDVPDHFASPPEPLEDVRLVSLGNADALVAHAQRGPAP